MQATLLKDITSNCKGLKKYGSRLDIVTIVCWHDDVAIVEDRKGERFPVREEKLSIKESEEKK